MKGAFKAIMTILIAGSGALCLAQTNGAACEHTLDIHGTSNMHDWVLHAGQVDVKASITTAEDDGTWNLSALTVEIPVEQIKSEKGSIMDKKTKKALMAEEHPVIRFTLPNATVLTPGRTNYIQGTLKIAGVSKTIDLAVAVNQTSSGELVCTGKKDLKMTDFKIDPPTALMGAMKTGDDISVKFSVTISNF